MLKAIVSFSDGQRLRFAVADLRELASAIGTLRWDRILIKKILIPRGGDTHERDKKGSASR